MELRTPLVLVTGATSAAGRRLVEGLIHGLPGQADLKPIPGLRVRCLALPGEDFAALRKISDRVQILVGDLRPPANAARLCHEAKDAVLFHLALARDRSFVRQLRQINVEATTGLLAAAAKAGVRRAVVLSDAAVCAGASTEKPLDEIAPAQPLTAWGRILQQRETAVSATKELETVILRCAPLIAAAVNGRRPLWFSLALAGQLPIHPPSEARLSLASPAVVAQACLRTAILRQAAGQVYWIAEESPCELAALCQTVRQLAEKESPALLAGGQPRQWAVPLKSRAAQLFGALGLGCASGDEALVVVRPLVVSVAKAMGQLGLRSPGCLEEALREVLLAGPPADAKVVQDKGEPPAEG
jgi:nucleoside-diphosphate-sugar epimerase